VRRQARCAGVMANEVMSERRKAAALQKVLAMPQHVCYAPLRVIVTLPPPVAAPAGAAAGFIRMFYEVMRLSARLRVAATLAREAEGYCAMRRATPCRSVHGYGKCRALAVVVRGSGVPAVREWRGRCR